MSEDLSFEIISIIIKFRKVFLMVISIFFKDEQHFGFLPPSCNILDTNTHILLGDNKRNVGLKKNSQMLNKIYY